MSERFIKLSVSLLFWSAIATVLWAVQDNDNTPAPPPKGEIRCYAHWNGTTNETKCIDSEGKPYISGDMALPNVEHHRETHTETTDRKVLSCPDGYEPLYVLAEQSITGQEFGPIGSTMSMGNTWGTLGYSYYAICFKHEFMEQVRKNPDLYMTPGVIRPV